MKKMLLAIAVSLLIFGGTSANTEAASVDNLNETNSIETQDMAWHRPPPPPPPRHHRYGPPPPPPHRYGPPPPPPHHRHGPPPPPPHRW